LLENLWGESRTVSSEADWGIGGSVELLLRVQHLFVRAMGGH